jgi:uncharacterized YigZ family protein
MDKKKRYTISKPARHKIKVNRSSFIGSVEFVSNSEEAESFILNIRDEFFKATHNCFAYRIDENQFRFSDDGEPSGTAGKPILMILEKYNIEQVALVITRNFGGIKLGRGGLIRAYSQCAEETIQQAGVKELIPLQQLKLSFPYNLTKNIENIVNKHSGRFIYNDYKNEVRVKIQIPKKLYSDFLKEILNLGSGKIQVDED